MRRIMVVGAGSLLVAGAFLVSAFRSSSQDQYYGYNPGDVSAASATVLNGFACGLGPAGLTFDSHATISNSGNVTLVCRSDTSPVAPPETLNQQGFLCGVPTAEPPFFAITTDSHLVWTKSGQATLVCHAKS